MHGLSPRDISLTQRQLAVSLKITETLPEMPTTVADLISQMAVADFSAASLPLELNQFGRVLQNQRNLDIISCIKSALTAPSCECDPAIKSAIFANANDPDGYPHVANFGKIKPYLIQILGELTDSHQQIILDDVTIRDMDMVGVKGLDLSGMSAKRALFCNVNMDHVIMNHADLTDAQFNSASLEHADFSRANITNVIFSEVYFRNTGASALTGNQSAIVQCTVIETDLSSLTGPTSMTCLKGNDITAIPDIEPFTLAPHKF